MEVINEAKRLINQTTGTLVEEQIQIAQLNIAAMLETQLGDSQQAMKGHMNDEVLVVKSMINKIENEVLPDNLKLVHETLDETKEIQKVELNIINDFVRTNIKNFD